MASTARIPASQGAPVTRGVSAYTAEFIGTLLLVFAIGAVASANTQVGLGFTDYVAIGLVYAFTLTALIATFGRFSGGHFNPAVTVGLLAARRISPANAIGYVVAQVIGGLAGAFLLWIAFSSDIQSIANLGAVTPTKELIVGKHGIWGGIIFEGVGAFILVGAAVSAAVGSVGELRLAPIVVGFAYGVANLVAAPFTGGAINPARALGPAIVGDSYAGNVLTFIVVYLLAPLVFAIAAAVVYTLLLGDDRHATGARTTAAAGDDVE